MDEQKKNFKDIADSDAELDNVAGGVESPANKVFEFLKQQEKEHGNKNIAIFPDKPI